VCKIPAIEVWGGVFIPEYTEHDEEENHKSKMQAIPIMDQSRHFALSLSLLNTKISGRLYVVL
jgi:hypothetical protein